MPQRASEKVDIPALIKGILNGYPGTSAIFREFLQNSDDAKAVFQTFVLDERTYPSETLVDPLLRDRQGPALFAINDGMLNENDWKALQTIHSSSKLSDGSATGKNGLGFRASYHLTENPHILSGPNLLILDPQNNFSESPGGAIFDVCDEGALFKDQLAAFLCATNKPSSPFPGTAFRLPLRTKEQARKSLIKNIATSVAEIRSLLIDFCTNDLEAVILFLKHIKSIEVKHVRSNGEMVTLGRVDVERTRISEETTTCTISVQRDRGRVTERLWHIQHFSISDDKIAKVLSARLGYDIGNQLHDEKLFPVVDLALPTSGRPVSGKLFTLLPLPIMTGFPLHLNAVFALTPDRQNLKNILEVGDQKSRERLLVEWNKAIFDALVPVAWARLAENVVGGPYDSYFPDGLWPPNLEDVSHSLSPYWGEIMTCVVKEVLRNQFSVFATITHNKEIKFVSLDDLLVLVAGPDSEIDPNLLSELGMDVVQPPSYIYAILSKLESHFDAPIVSPGSLYQELREMFSYSTNHLYDRDTRPLTDYLASLTSPDQNFTVRFIRHIPLFTLEDQSHVALGFLDQKYIIPSSEEEFALFGGHCRILSSHCMSEELRNEISHPDYFQLLNVSTLNPQDIVLVLRKKFGRYKANVDCYTKEDETWLVRFWTWIATWPKLKAFWELEDHFSSLNIIPLTGGRLCAFSTRSFLFRRTNPEAVKAWAMLGVYPLNEKLRALVTKLEYFVESPYSVGYVDQLLRTCNADRQSLLSPEAFWFLQESLCISILSGEKKLEQRQKLAKMCVFMVKSNADDSWVPGPIHGKRLLYVEVEDTFPLPINPEKDVVYINMRDPETAELVALLDSNIGTHADEHHLLELAFENWAHQDPDIIPLIIDWVFTNVMTLPKNLLSLLNNVPFVSVEGASQLVPPVGLIGPTSALRRLYEGEAGKILEGKFSAVYLPTMRQLGLVHESLDNTIVVERLQYLSNITDDPIRFQKSKLFIQLCNSSWKSSFVGLFVNARAHSWMPIKPNVFSSPNECRDMTRSHTLHDHPHLYDLVLSTVAKDIQITSPDFRDALGWAEKLGLDVLLKQLSLAIKTVHSVTRTERLIALIDYLGQLHDQGDLHDEYIEQIHSVTVGKRWIPVSRKGQCIEAKYALLSDDIDLKTPFSHIYDFQHTEFLELLGCSQRPSSGVLIEELKNVNFTTSKGISTSISLLQELVTSRADFEPALVFVPGNNNRGVPISQAYYRDSDHIHISGSATNLTPIHKNVSRALAEALGVQFLSSAMLEDPENIIYNDDDIQMSEDLVTRIRGFLREYDIRYALNEFLANADDAKAKSFSITLDTPAPSGKKLLSPAFETLRGVSALILRNSARLADSDFLGLRKIGIGGKVDQSETHGRHGLGAFSFFYFTDVVTVISGETVLLLDPSGEYLPRRNGLKRTSLKANLTWIMTFLLSHSERRWHITVVRNYPDQLRAYASRYHFSNKYEGTIFLLPLKSTISPTPCSQLELHDYLKGSYRTLANNAFFFTALKEISAKEYTTSGDRCLWSFTAIRSSDILLGGHPHQYRSDLTIQCRSAGKTQVVQKWLITKSTDIPIPSRHQATAKGLKQHSTTNIGLAIAIDPPADDVDSFLFSTLRLPKATSMPYHLNARFALSSNRQTIVLDPAGSDNETDPKSAFNLWILQDVVPDLYASTLHYMRHRDQDPEDMERLNHGRYWLLCPQDDISKIAQQAFFNKLAKSDLPLILDVTSTWIQFREAIFSSVEPPSVTDLLSLIGTPKFVNDDWVKGLAEMASARTVDANFTRISLSGCNMDTIEDLCEEADMEYADLIPVLEYIHNEPDLVALPLLVLSFNRVASIPSINDTPVYYSADPAMADLFASSQFLSKKYTDSTVQRLTLAQDINVLDLTEDSLFTLIDLELENLKSRHSRDRWLKAFWNAYSKFPGPPTLSSLQTSGLATIRSKLNYLSLAECVLYMVVLNSRSTKKPDPLVKILEKLNVDVLDVRNNSLIDDHIRERFPDGLTNVLLCMDSENRGLALWDSLASAETKYISDWIQKHLPAAIEDVWKTCVSDVPRISTSLLRKLPIWEAQTREQGRGRHCATKQLKVLPQHFSPTHLLPYQRSGVTVAPWSNRLVEFMHYLDNSFGMLSLRDIMQIVQMPSDPIPKENMRAMETMKKFVISILRLGQEVDINNRRNISLKVPDHEGFLRDVDTLFDDNVPLFEITLNSTRRSSFVHSTFDDLRGQLREFGLKHEVNLETFKTCAEAIEKVAMDLETVDQVDDQDLTALFEKADTAFQAYQATLPTVVKLNAVGWKSLDSIRFLRASRTGRQGASFYSERYCSQSGIDFILASPSRFVRLCLVPIAWTQRFSFNIEPSEEVLTFNKALGVPTAREVVAHLKVLAIEISRDHRGDSTLLSDLKATYLWLDEYAQEPRVYLLEEADTELFLNVDDPETEDWNDQWVSAGQMLRHMNYDIRSLRRVKSFLKVYDKLLESAGCKSLKATSGLAPANPDGERLQSSQATFNEMRMKGEFTDVILAPRTCDDLVFPNDDEEDDQNVAFPDSGNLEAHRVFLASTIPYIRDSAQDWMKTGEIAFYGSAVGANALLDFAYTGDFFVCPAEPLSKRQSATMLQELFGLMSIADEWDMPDFMRLIESKIIFDYHLIENHPDKHRAMLAQAVKYSATTLSDALMKFGKDNKQILDALERSKRSKHSN